MAQTTYQKIEEYIDLMIARGYSATYIIEQLETKRDNLVSRYEELEENANNATGNLTTPIYLLSDFLRERRHPKPAYLSDMSIHPAVRRYFEALYNVVDDYELYLAPPCNPDEFIAIEEHFEIKLPKALKDFYLITNGESSLGNYFNYYHLSFLSNIDNSVVLQRSWEKESLFKASKPLAFACDNCGNYLVLDSDPENNLETKILEFGADIFETVFICLNFEIFLDTLSHNIENGKLEITCDYDEEIEYKSFEWYVSFYDMFHPKSK